MRFFGDFGAVNSHSTLWSFLFCELHFPLCLLCCIYLPAQWNVLWLLVESSFYMFLWTARYQSNRFYTLFKLNSCHISNRFVSSLHSSLELFISMGYAAEANRHISASVNWKVPYFLPASGFFRCLQAQWRLLRMDWGARQLVFTTVIDRRAQESGLLSFWCLSPGLACSLMSNQTASCLMFVCASTWVHCPLLCVDSSCMANYINCTLVCAYMWEHMVEYSTCVEACPPLLILKRISWVEHLQVGYCINNKRTSQLFSQIIQQPSEHPVGQLKWLHRLFLALRDLSLSLLYL